MATGVGLVLPTGGAGGSETETEREDRTNHGRVMRRMIGRGTEERREGAQPCAGSIRPHIIKEPPSGGGREEPGEKSRLSDTDNGFQARGGHTDLARFLFAQPAAGCVGGGGRALASGAVSTGEWN